MALSSSNIFKNNSSSKETMIFGPRNKLGSYRFEQGRQLFRLKPHEINEHWAECPPLALTTKEELLHLSTTELRVEDYYLIRSKQITPQHQQKINQLIKQNAYNSMLNKVPCRNLTSIFQSPYDIARIKRQNQKKTKNQIVSIFSTNAITNLQGSTNQCSNVFSTNQDAGLTKVPSENIFSRNSSANNLYQPIANTSNTYYRPTNSSISQNSNNIFADYAAKNQANSSTDPRNLLNNKHTNTFNNNPNNTNTNGPNIFNRNNLPCSSSATFNNNNNIFNRNYIPNSCQNIFNRNNIFQSNSNNPNQNPANVKKQVEISLKLSENNVIYQKIITTDNNIKIYLDCSQMIQSASLRQHSTTFNSVIAAKSEHSDMTTDRIKEERQRRMPQKVKEKSTVPLKREQHVTIHNFDKKEQALEESQIRKCDFALKLHWLQEGKEEKYINGSIDIGGFFPKDEEWCRRFIKQLKLSHLIVRKDAQLEGLVCKIDPKGYAMITGTIAQSMINLPDYEVEYEKLTNEYAEGLKITNKHGSISWEQPVRIAELDFQEMDFAINENEVMMPTNSPLNTACLVTFYRLPARIQMMIQEDQYDEAFERLSRIVEKTCPGTASLKVLNEHFWRMHLTKFS